VEVDPGLVGCYFKSGILSLNGMGSSLPSGVGASVDELGGQAMGAS